MISKLSEISLRDVDSENVKQICSLSVSAMQGNYVVSTAIAIAEAAYNVNEWLRAIYADDFPVGLAVVRQDVDNSRYLLWRLMIDKRYQGLKFGTHAMGLIIHTLRQDFNCDEFFTSVVAGPESPQRFYENLGFTLTGDFYEGEAVLKLKL